MQCKSFSTGANKLIESLQLRRHFTETTVVKEQIERCILERKKNVEVVLVSSIMNIKAHLN